ncbi:hypothetical protein GGH12_003033 [Coemansia sp. RSA 1822]|nr:hypothetical protein LPJ76_002849 [Coemansia sp. RSA 638]KAJ2542530.1 hypothetical protein GGF49_002816 [Coemansia sp. RSA 1853]KAJ2562715.1 hypothetical protein GGH12_003033 [Coemansia sp. RSA 1822]
MDDLDVSEGVRDERRAEMGGLENGSDTDTDLDLPHPDSFLSSPSHQSASREEIVLAPETPPATTCKDVTPETPPVTTCKNGVTPETPPVTTCKNGVAPETPPVTLCKDKTVNTPQATTNAVRSTRLKRKSVGTSSMTVVDLNSSITSDDATAGPESPDNVASTRPKTKRKKSVSDTLHILTTGLTDAQTARLRRAAKQVSTTGTAISIHTSVNHSIHSYTHVVTPAGKDMRVSRTFKYLVGLACGARIVTPDWLFECAKRNSLVSESPYAVKGDSATPTHMLQHRNAGELFATRSFYLWGEPSCWDAGSAHSRDDLVFLLRMAGARVVDELPEIEEDEQDTESDSELTCAVSKCMGKDLVKVPQKYRAQFALPISDKPIVLVDASSLKGARCSTTMSAITTATANLPCRTKSWLFDCISTNQIL